MAILLRDSWAEKQNLTLIFSRCAGLLTPGMGWAAFFSRKPPARCRPQKNWPPAIFSRKIRAIREKSRMQHKGQTARASANMIGREAQRFSWAIHRQPLSLAATTKLPVSVRHRAGSEAYKHGAGLLPIVVCGRCSCYYGDCECYHVQGFIFAPPRPVLT
jgi:hypothetical protein